MENGTRKEAWGGLGRAAVAQRWFKMMCACVLYLYSLRRQIQPMKHKFRKDEKVPVMSPSCLSHHLDTPSPR